MFKFFLRKGNYLLLFCLFAACQKTPDSSILSEISINSQIETEPPRLIPVIKTVNAAVGGYYVGLPFLYDQTTKKYPCIIFLPGGGQIGNGAIDLPLLLNDGIMQMLDEKVFPPNFESGGKNFSFVIITPQFRRTPSSAELQSLVDFVKLSYRVDTTRLYLSGLSYGGILASEIAALDPSKYAALVTMAGTFFDSAAVSKCRRIAASNLPVWCLHNSADPVIPSSSSTNFVNNIQSFNPTVPPKLTIFNRNVHDCWTQCINPSFKENNLNIYEFMLQYRR